MQTIRIATTQNIDIDYEIAGLGERILARLIDTGVLFAIYIAAMLSGGLLAKQVVIFKESFPLLILFMSMLIVFYDLVSEVFFNGQSVGKRIMKIKVISTDGSRPSFGQYVIRWLFRIIDFLITFQLAALISAILTEKNQRIGDILAGTAMIKTVPRTNLFENAFNPVPDDYKPVFHEAGNLKNHEIVLIYEVLANFEKSDNYPLLHATASRLRKHLDIPPVKMDDITFLNTLIKDYNFSTAAQA